MDVALDTNILLADAWFEGQKTRALLDFVTRTRSKLLIHEVVAQELRAVLDRQWRSTLAEMEGAVRKAKRQGLQAPDVEIEPIIEAARSAWEQKYKKLRWHIQEIALEPTLLQEALRRAAYRIPPCARSGEEIRDALLWLGLMKHCESLKPREIAFITQNSRDFCGSEAGELHPELALDADTATATVHFYTSLDDFLREHAKPIEHLTPDWVIERIDMDHVIELIVDYLRLRDASDYQVHWNYEEWKTTGYPRITSVDADLSDVYVWEYTADEPMTVFLGFGASIEAEANAEREEGDPEWGYYTERRQIPVTAQWHVEISATAEVDKVELVEVEYVERI